MIETHSGFPAIESCSTADTYANCESPFIQYPELMPLDQLLDYDEPYDDPDLEHLRQLHLNCSTFWLGQVGTCTSAQGEGFVKYNVTQNHCNDRSCPVCVKHRIGQARARIFPYIDFIRKPKHQVLTSKNMVLTHEQLSLFRRQLKAYNRAVVSYFKRHNKKRGTHYQYFGIYVLEYKRNRKTGLYHVHTHIASNITPPQKKMTDIWSKILGYKTQAYVKYHSSKESLLNYFARRIAMVGMGMLPVDYLTFCKRAKNYHSFGYLHVPNPRHSLLEKLEQSIQLGRFQTAFSSYVQDTLATAEPKISWRTMIRLKKAQCTTRPPDFLTHDYLRDLVIAENNAILVGEELNKQASQADYELRRWNLDHNPVVMAHMEEEGK